MAGRALVALMLLLTDVAADKVFGRGSYDLGIQDVVTCKFPDEYILEDVAVNTNISVTCQEGCVRRALNNSDNGQLVYGTGIYSLDSDLCLAAVHDARLPHPSKFSSALLLLTVVQHNRPLSASFRRGVFSVRKNLSARALRFVSPHVIEDIPDITTVHTHFRSRQGYKSYLEVQLGVNQSLGDIRCYNVGDDQETELIIKQAIRSVNNAGSYEIISSSNTAGLAELQCRVDNAVYSDTTSLQYLSNAYYQASADTSHANRGEDKTMSVASYSWRSAPNQAVWWQKGINVGTSARVGTRYSVTIADVNEENAGVYLVTPPNTEYDYATATRLIVRGCPADLFGTTCDQKCPYCLHGGQCHDVTGQCVCPPGFVGSRCQTGCPEAHFGRTCSSVCPTNTWNSCGGRLLCVPDPYGCTCAAGYSGYSCYNGCRRGSYGPNCAFSCGRCSHGVCDRFTGACESGCENSSLLPPLCQPLWPWFREQPQLEQVGYNSLVVSHPAWRPQYDNGFGSGNYQYIVNFRLAGNDRAWIQPDTSVAIDDSSLPGDRQVRFELQVLYPDTRYDVRIIIYDNSLRAAQVSNSRVPFVSGTTDCAAPNMAKLLRIEDLTNVSASAVIEGPSNDRVACLYKLNVTVTSASAAARGTFTRLLSPRDSRADLANLSPNTEYSVAVLATNRKGSSRVSSLSFITPEGAPSRVRNLQVVKIREKTFKITWDLPDTSNGIIRAYHVLLEHESYLACGVERDSADRIVVESKTRRQKIVTVRHAFSEYRATVWAQTLIAGPASILSFNTSRTAPSAGIASSAVTAWSTSVTVTWTWSRCTMWGDTESNLRLLVKVSGQSAWNRHLKYERNATGQAFSPTVTLTPFSNYSLQLYVYNSVGFFPSPDVHSVVTKESRPGVPANVTVVHVSPRSITIGWQPPRPPLSRITAYVIRTTHLGTSEPERRHKLTDVCSFKLQPPCRRRLTSLRENTQYQFTVYAYNRYREEKGNGASVRGVTEGKPGPPLGLRLVGRSRTALNISWREPTDKNGRLRGFRLNITMVTDHSRRRRREPVFFRSISISVHRESRRDGDASAYTEEVRSLGAGQTYEVTVAANTSAGYGPASEARLSTLVAPPAIAQAPRVHADRTTDTTVELVLPPVDQSGGPVAAYYVVVSTDPHFNGNSIGPQLLPNFDQGRAANLTFYVTAALDKERADHSSTFVVGDGHYYNNSRGHFHNRPLKTDTKYVLGVAVLSRLSEDNQALAFKAITKAVLVSGTNDAALIAILVFFLMLAIVTAVAAVFFWRRRKENKAYIHQHQDSTTVKNRTDARNNLDMGPLAPAKAAIQPEAEEVLEVEDDEQDIYENLQESQINFSRVEVQDLLDVIQNDLRSGSLKSQWQSLPHGLRKPYDYGSQVHNKKKNRYVNLIAYDDSRVVLEKLEDDPLSDYINANYVDGYQRERAFIATQGPKKDTTFDFWRMVWQERVQRIVMLTNLVEGGKRKCEQYWPDKDTLHLPGMVVSKEAEIVYADYCIRTFSIVADGSIAPRTVTQLHYTAWPDHSVPLYPTSLAKFVRALDGVPDGQGPTVVHCSAGVGRTGTVILIDAMYQMGRQERAVDVYSHMAVIRQQRANLCANYDQYRLVHQVLEQLLVAPQSAVAADQLAGRLAALRSRADGPSELERQLRYLEASRPPASFATAQAALANGNNRDPDVLPEDSSRVYLDPLMPDSYINAVYVTGYKAPDMFIATEAPLPGRISIFWDMVAQKYSSTIVVMSDVIDVFWPSKDKKLVYKSLEVEAQSVSEAADVTTLHLRVKIFKAGRLAEIRDVRLLRLTTAGSGVDTLPSAGQLVQLHQALVQCGASSSSAPSVVVCRTGVTGCGMFLTCCFALGHLSEEHELDVLLAVSAVRKSRPQFIATLEQFELCYDVALKWLEAFAIYSNFQQHHIG